MLRSGSSSMQCAIKKACLGSPKLFCFTRTIITSIPKVRVCRDKRLDAVADNEKVLAPVLRIRDAILKFKTDSIPLRYLLIRRRLLGFKMPDAKFQDFIMDYPNMFQIFTHPEEKLPWCRITPQVVQLLDEERGIHAQEEPVIVEKLRRLLMLSRDRCIRSCKIELACVPFGFPEDIVRTIVPKYPEYFRLVQRGEPYEVLELTAWDENLAVTEFERKAKRDAKEFGLGDIETHGKPLAFKTRYFSGMKLKKKQIHSMENWQRLPYICPYQKAGEEEAGTPLAERRMIALIHEILSLTIERRILTEVLDLFKKDFDLPSNIFKVVNKLPGMFYLSIKGSVHTLFLREAYQDSRLMVEHPLLDLKAKYLKLSKVGPHMRLQLTRSNQIGLKATVRLKH